MLPKFGHPYPRRESMAKKTDTFPAMTTRRLRLRQVESRDAPGTAQLLLKELSVHRVEALIHPDNVGSIRIVEKLGFRCEAAHWSIIGAWENDT
jgi:hypothetical protein